MDCQSSREREREREREGEREIPVDSSLLLSLLQLQRTQNKRQEIADTNFQKAVINAEKESDFEEKKAQLRSKVLEVIDLKNDHDKKYEELSEFSMCLSVVIHCTVNSSTGVCIAITEVTVTLPPSLSTSLLSPSESLTRRTDQETVLKNLQQAMRETEKSSEVSHFVPSTCT